LKDEDSDVREAAIQALGQFRDPRAAEPLVAALRNWPSTFSIGRSLKQIGEPSVEPLIAALKDDNPAVRATAAKTLGNIEDPRAVEPLISALKDEDRNVRLNVVTALRWIRDPRAVEPLIALLKDEDVSVQSEAVSALRAISRKDFGRDPEEWQKWWDENKETLLKGK